VVQGAEGLGAVKGGQQWTSGGLWPVSSQGQFRKVNGGHGGRSVAVDGTQRGRAALGCLRVHDGNQRGQEREEQGFGHNNKAITTAVRTLIAPCVCPKFDEPSPGSAKLRITEMKRGTTG
jgi:hypothetical protein